MGVRAAMIDDVIVAQMRHAVTQLVSDLNDALRKQVCQAHIVRSQISLPGGEVWWSLVEEGVGCCAIATAGGRFRTGCWRVTVTLARLLPFFSNMGTSR